MGWDIVDFLVFGGMVAAVGLAWTLVVRRSGSSAYRFGAGIALAAAFLLLWVNGAVGIIGDEGNPANRMFFGVLAVGLLGAALARLRPPGMVRTMAATAMAQLLVAVIAITGDLGRSGPAWPRDILFLTTFFTALWILSAWLFRKAAATDPGS